MSNPAKERLLDAIMIAVHDWHRREDVAMQSPEDMRRRISAGLAMPDATAADLAADASGARVLIRSAIADLGRSSDTEAPAAAVEQLKRADELLVAVGPYLAGADFSDRIPKPAATWRDRVRALFGRAEVAS